MMLRDEHVSSAHKLHDSSAPTCNRKNGSGWVICPVPGEPSIKLFSAIQFTYDTLVDAYNHTRVDYIVPMPMNTTKLKDYVRTYDVDLELSCVATEDERILGLAMLGVRPYHTWVTRLGVLPNKRRRGTGEMLMNCLIEQSRNLDMEYITLDVIKNNEPAHQLFRKLGFYELRELLIVRRPPGQPRVDVGPYILQPLNHLQAADILQKRQSRPSWLDERASLINAGNLAGIYVELPSGEKGWLVYQKTVFQLSRLVLQTEAGDHHKVGLTLIHALHSLHPALDTKSENLPLNCPHWPAMQEMGYIESFRRIEMRLDFA
jgi:ribosomal protein S18 acetylase RimI-like enzyme